ncbi:hypothetical protein RJ45_25260 [Photobacterium gaetbulicola]|uniref:Pilus assembly protein PilW n=1 Tax=Photobacterium gaetbulicola TaxID=1295392 RepID=A0A0B9FQW1_9GAMM|nr:hypothetical protein [Photobacterium gaetbulicola]KHT58434.1 hypothetical protein RJ45_25260 [Photobacterium gaetbulicola]
MKIRKKQNGMKLIELMLACAMGSVLLMVLASVFASGMNTSNRIGQQLNFDSEFHDLGQFIRNDLRRAGFSIEGKNAGTVKWEDSPLAVYVNAAQDCVAYAYEFTDGGAEKIRFSSLYVNEESELILYTLMQSVTATPKNIASACAGGEAITVNAEILLTNFVVDVSQYPLVAVAMSARSPVNGSQDDIQLNVAVMNN